MGTDREFSAKLDHRAIATNSVLLLGLCPPKLTEPSPSLFRFTEERRSPESGSSFRSSEELPAGFTTVIYGCRR
jgi:hypothetical protein